MIKNPRLFKLLIFICVFMIYFNMYLSSCHVRAYLVCYSHPSRSKSEHMFYVNQNQLYDCGPPAVLAGGGLSFTLLIAVLPIELVESIAVS